MSFACPSVEFCNPHYLQPAIRPRVGSMRELARCNRRNTAGCPDVIPPSSPAPSQATKTPMSQWNSDWNTINGQVKLLTTQVRRSRGRFPFCGRLVLIGMVVISGGPDVVCICEKSLRWPLKTPPPPRRAVLCRAAVLFFTAAGPR